MCAAAASTARRIPPRHLRRRTPLPTRARKQNKLHVHARLLREGISLPPIHFPLRCPLPLQPPSPPCPFTHRWTLYMCTPAVAIALRPRSATASSLRPPRAAAARTAATSRAERATKRLVTQSVSNSPDTR